MVGRLERRPEAFVMKIRSAIRRDLIETFSGLDDARDRAPTLTRK
jgi:hypothetical protein